jgi:hypothetical protein
LLAPPEHGGTKPKVPPPVTNPLLVPPDTPSHFSFTSPSTPAIVSKPPKIPPFSGDEPLAKGEISFYEWRHEVRCLMRDSSIPKHQVLQAIRTSLRGTARRLVVSLGDSVSIDSIFQKLEFNFGEPARQGITMREFFNCSQRPNESVTSFGCRLEITLEQAFEGGHIPRSGRNELLCERLWSGLLSETLKTNTRHKLDTAVNYDHFLRDVRQAEKELSLTNNTKVKAHANLQTSTFDVKSKMEDLEKRLNSKISHIQSACDKKFNTIIERLDSMSASNRPSPPQHLFNQPPPPLPPSFNQPPSFVQPQATVQPNKQYQNNNTFQRKSNRYQNKQQQNRFNFNSSVHPNYQPPL